MMTTRAGPGIAEIPLPSSIPRSPPETKKLPPTGVGQESSAVGTTAVIGELHRRFFDFGRRYHIFRRFGKKPPASGAPRREDQGEPTPRRPAKSSMNCLAVRPLREPAESAHRSASSRSVAGSTGRRIRRAYDSTTSRYVSWSNR